MGQPTIQFLDVLNIINSLQAQLNALKQSALPTPSAGTAGSFVIVNGGGSGYALITLSGDVTSSNNTPGQTTVVSISSLIPAISSTQNNSPFQTLGIVAGATAVNAALGDNCYLNLVTNTTIAKPLNPKDGQVLTFLFTNNSAPQTVGWNPIFTFQNNSAPVVPGSTNSIIAFRYNLLLNVWAELYRALGQFIMPLASFYGPPPPISAIIRNWTPGLPLL